jgi:ligand-binding sensor domain-containing protein/two-component sensor histidine kinase
MRIAVFFWSVFFLASYAVSQEFAFRSYSVAEGLPQSQVTSITQDSVGFLWVGTLGGVARFSGLDFETYSTENGLLNNRISLLQFIDGVLYVGHENGVSFQKSGRFVPFRIKGLQEGIKVTAIVRFLDKIYIGTNGGGLFLFNGNSFLKVKPLFQQSIDEEEFNRIRDVHVQDNRMYIATRSGLAVTEDGLNFAIIKGSEEISISGLDYSPEYGLVCSSYGDGLWVVKNNRFRPLRLNGISPEGSFKSVFVDHKGKIWLPTKSEGVFSIHRNQQQQLHSGNGLPLDNVSCIFEDNTRSIWMGTEGKGLVRFTGEAFVHYTKRSGIISELIISISQSKNGEYWFGTYASGVSMKRNGEWFTWNEETGLSNNTIWSTLSDSRGVVWFGTGNGISRWMNGSWETWNMDSHPQLPSNKITALYEDRKKRIWIGGKDGVAVYDGSSLKKLSDFATRVPDLQNVRDFTQVNNRLFFGSQSGIHCVEDNLFEDLTPSNFSNAVVSLEADYRGQLWVGTEDGLYIFSDSKLQQLNYSDFSGSNFINFICRDDDKMWVGTNNGVFRFTFSESGGWRAEQFGLTDGLVSLETNLNAAFVDVRGNFWFGTSEGLMRFAKDLENTYALTVKPGLLFGTLQVNYRMQSFEEKSLDERGVPSSLSFRYSENQLIFDFIPVLLTSPEDMRMQYFLEGLSTEWSPLSSSFQLVFSGLSSGNYVLRARAVSKSGVFSDELVIPFRINPPFYATWWFILLMCGIVVSGVVGVFRIKLRQQQVKTERENLELTSRLRELEQQSLNASMNRHFIFNALNSIQYFINTSDKLSANKYLTQFAKLIRKNLDSSSDGERNVTLQEEIERLKLYLSLESMRFKDKFSFSFDIDPSIDAEELEVPSMLFQPFIENSIIHGILPQHDRKGEIVFRARREGVNVVFTIEDNGVGYEHSIRHKSADGDHKSKGMSITSSRIDLLRQLSGKSFQLIGPVELKNDAGESIGTRVTIKIQDNSLDDKD